MTKLIEPERLRTKMRKQLTALFTAAIVSLSGLAMATEQKTEVIAVVNGTQLTEEDFQAYAKLRLGVRPGPNLPADKRAELMEELINRELIYQQALAEGFDKSPEVQRMIQEQIRNILTSQRIKKLLDETPISEAELRKIYQEQVSQPAAMEYRARHILLKTEEEAKQVIAELNKGADFITLAKERSIGPSAVEGGDLGWFALNQMVQPFANAVAKLKPGQYSKRAVKTKYGWHVIRLEEAREVQPPAFETMERQLRSVAQNQIVSDFIASLKAKGQVEIKP